MMKYPLIVIVKNKAGEVVDANACSYSWDLENVIKRCEEGDTFALIKPRPEPEPEADEA